MDAGDYDTNNLVLDGIAAIAYATYTPTQLTSPASLSWLLRIAHDLRSAKILTHVDTTRMVLWHLFITRKDGTVQGDDADLQGWLDRGELDLVDSGAYSPSVLCGGMDTLAGTTSANPCPVTASVAEPGVGAAAGTDPKHVLQYFELAVYASITLSICSKTGAIPVSTHELLLIEEAPKTGYEGDSISGPLLVVLRLSLYTSGSLLVNIAVKTLSNIDSLGQVESCEIDEPNRKILLAPFGVEAEVVTSSEVSAIPTPQVGQSHCASSVIPQHLAKSNMFAGWQRIVAQFLQYSGLAPVNLINYDTWVTVRSASSSTTQSPVTYLWPRYLCFVRLGRASEHVIPSSGALETRVDVLDDAQNWFNKEDERQLVFSQRTKDREATRLEQTRLEETRTHSGQGQSPHSLRPPSVTQNAAAGAMYPTPPDGVLNLSGSTPSMDAALSSPEIMAASTARTGLMSNVMLGGVGQGVADAWESSDTRRNPTADTFMMQNDNVFGDFGEDAFTNNDITDADFSFFDEDPDLMDVVSSSVQVDATPDIDDTSPPTLDTSIEVEETTNSIEADTMPLSESEKPVFTKPELHHARSNIADIPQHPLMNTSTEIELKTIKRPRSPFDPSSVFKRLRLSFEAQNPVSKNMSTSKTTRRLSTYDCINFDNNVSCVNTKYQTSGHFNYGENTEDTNNSPMLGVGPLRRRSQASSVDMSALMGKMSADVDHEYQDDMLLPNDVVDLDNDDESLMSDSEDLSDSKEDEVFSPYKPSLQSLSMAQSAQSPPASPGGSIVLSDMSEHLAKSLSQLGAGLREHGVLSKFLQVDPDLSNTLPIPPNNDDILVAQILTDQAASGNILATNDLFLDDASVTRLGPSRLIRNLTTVIHDELPTALTSAANCTLRSLLAIQHASSAGTQGRPLPRAPGGPEKANTIVRLLIQHLELRRNDTKISILPSAIGFWESLGLMPAFGSKDVEAVCLFPGQIAEQDVSIFLDRTRNVYESLKLGTFSVLPGLFAYDGHDTSMEDALEMQTHRSMEDSVHDLADALTKSHATATNFVVYMVYSDDTPNTIVECCRGFHQLGLICKQKMSMGHKVAQNELVLQLIPAGYITSLTTLAVPAPADHVRLCLGVYDRCNKFDGSMTAPAIMLEQVIGRPIEFQLKTPTSSNILKENSCMHLAYASSADDRWLTVAWTDNTGRRQSTASYNRGRRDLPLSVSFEDVAREVWETTLELVSTWSVQWRIIITKCGVMTSAEVDTWSGLAKLESTVSTSLLLLGVETEPNLQLIPPAVKLPVTASSGLCITPDSTPQVFANSPEQMSTPMTPGITPSAVDVAAQSLEAGSGDSDADATLVDVNDTTWGAVMSHTLVDDDNNNMTGAASALVSGYLVQRCGPRVDDAPVVMKVDLLHYEGNLRVQDLAFREIISHFRGLNTLAKARSIVDEEGDVRPWHVAAAQKAVHALHRLM